MTESQFCGHSGPLQMDKENESEDGAHEPMLL